MSAKNRRLDSLAWLIYANDGCASATFVDGQILLATNSSRISDMPSIRINRQEVKLYEGVMETLHRFTEFCRDKASEKKQMKIERDPTQTQRQELLEGIA